MKNGISEIEAKKKGLLEKITRDRNEIERDQKAIEERMDKANRLADPDYYFDGRTFVPVRMADALKKLGEYRWGYDEENGNGRLMIYKDGVFRPATKVDRLIQELLQGRTRDSHIGEAIAALERSAESKPWDQWNRNRRLINCTSGMLDPSTLELMPHSPKYLSTFQIPVAWEPEIESNRVDTFLHELLAPELVETLLESIGYFATCDISAKHFFIFEGSKNTGKTEMLNLIRNFIGPRNTAICSLHDIADSRFAAAALENKMLGIYDDISNVPIRNTSTVKALTGKFPTTRIERKGVDAYGAPLYARLLFTCNKMPNCLSDHTEAWADRPLIMPFKTVITDETADPGLTAELAKPDCLQRLFYLAVIALQRLIGRKMQFSPTRSIGNPAAERRKNDDSVTEFVKECCPIAPENSVGKVEWFEKYQEYCPGRGYRALGRNKAYERLLSIPGVSAHKVPKGKHVFKGITISPGRTSE